MIYTRAKIVPVFKFLLCQVKFSKSDLVKLNKQKNHTTCSTSSANQTWQWTIPIYRWFSHDNFHLVMTFSSLPRLWTPQGISNLIPNLCTQLILKILSPHNIWSDFPNQTQTSPVSACEIVICQQSPCWMMVAVFFHWFMFKPKNLKSKGAYLECQMHVSISILLFINYGNVG